MDKISVNNISCRAYVGVLPQEQENPQQIAIDLTLSLDLKLAIQKDQVKLTVDYKEIVERVERTLSKRKFKLLETLADCVCRLLLTDTRIKTAHVKVRKFPESLRNRVDYVEVEMIRAPD